MKLTELPTELLLHIAYDQALTDNDRLNLRLTCTELCNVISMHPFLDIIIDFGVHTRVADKTTTQRLVSLMSEDERLKAMRSLIRSIRVDALDRLSGMTNFTKRTLPTLMESGMLPKLEKVSVNADLLHAGNKDIERLLKLLCRYYYEERELNVSLHNMTLTPIMLRHVSHLTSLDVDLARFTSMGAFNTGAYARLIADAIVKSPSLKHLSIFTCVVFCLDDILDRIPDDQELPITSLSLQNIYLPFKADNCAKLMNLRNLALPTKERPGIGILHLVRSVQTAMWTEFKSRGKTLDSLQIPGHNSGLGPIPLNYEEPLNYLQAGGATGLRKLTLCFKYSAFHGLTAIGENGTIARVGNALWHRIFPFMRDTAEEVCIEITHPFGIAFYPSSIGASREYQFSSLCPKPGNSLNSPTLKTLKVYGVYRADALTDFMESVRGCGRLRTVELTLVQCEDPQLNGNTAAAVDSKDADVGEMISSWKAPLDQSKQWNSFLRIDLKVYKLTKNNNGVIYINRRLERDLYLSMTKENLVFKVSRWNSRRYN